MVAAGQMLSAGPEHGKISPRAISGYPVVPGRRSDHIRVDAALPEYIAGYAIILSK